MWISFNFINKPLVHFIGIGFRNQVTGYTYGILEVLGSSVNLTNCFFSGNSYAITLQNSAAYFQNVVFINNDNSMVIAYSGSGNTASMTATNVTIKGKGIGISIEAGPSTFVGNQIVMENILTGIYIGYIDDNFDITITDVTFNGLSSAVYAYGLNEATGRILLNNANFTNNGIPTGKGGGIYVGQGIQIQVNGGVFDNNVAKQGGGFWCGDQGALNLQSVVLTNNSADDGGAGWCDQYCAFLGTNLTISNNKESKDTGPCPDFSRDY